jgi:upstream activation factor subunit UAF30
MVKKSKKTTTEPTTIDDLSQVSISIESALPPPSVPISIESESESIIPPSVESTVVVDEPVLKKKKRVSKKEKVSATPSEILPVEIPIELPVIVDVSIKEEDISPVVVEEEIVTSKKEKRVVKKEDIAKDLELLNRDVLEQIQDKNLIKRFKQFKTDIIKILKLKNLANKKERDISNSGFMKPVGVSPKMRSFLDLGENETTRRLDITKRICNYIKEHDLQDPKDRRNILVDPVLKDLLNVQPNEQITYYSIQQKLKDHIIKLT